MTLHEIRKHGETLHRRGQAGKTSVRTAHSHAACRQTRGAHARRARLVYALPALLVGLLAGCSHTAELKSFTQLLAHAESTQVQPGTPSEEIAINHLQLKGSHNSYHQAPRMPMVKAWRYSHLPLDKQLENQGVRQIELDVRYSGGEVVVGHLPVLDGRSSCRTLKACLQKVRNWSSEHPAHLPVFVFIEPKEHVSPSNLDGRLEVLDRTIASVFPRKSLIVPEDVAGGAASLKEAVQTRGWPTLEASRGKVMFVLFGRENHTRAYARGRPRLDGRLMFATGTLRDAHAAVASYDDPVKQQGDIALALGQNMLVRTRADGDLRKDTRRRDAALASGAHFIGSDFVDPKTGWLDLGTLAPARCNPKSAASACMSAALQEEASSIAALKHTPAQNTQSPAAQRAPLVNDAQAMPSMPSMPSIEAMP